jgi:hypothetical protein
VRHYRDAWVTVTAVVLVCGVWLAIADYTVLTAVTIFFFAWVMGGCALFMLYDDARPRCGKIRLVTESALIGLAAVAASGMVALLGAAACLPLVCLAASSPWAVRRAMRVSRRRDPADKPMGDKPPTEPVPGPLTEPSPVVFPALIAADLDLEELCWAWRRSYVRLLRCRTAVETARVVAERQQCLDELERRNPEGLSSWLEAGARAAGDPTRFVMPTGPTDVRDNAA